MYIFLKKLYQFGLIGDNTVHNENCSLSPQTLLGRKQPKNVSQLQTGAFLMKEEEGRAKSCGRPFPGSRIKEMCAKSIPGL